MELADTTPNPFALLITPDAVFAALSRSDRLSRLSSRICRRSTSARRASRALKGRTAEIADSGSALRVTLAS
jgi:hypothetical protein